MRVLIVGCGYVGLPLAMEMARQGHEVFGLRRSAAMKLRSAGITPLTADITRPETLAGLPGDFDWVVNCVSSGGGDAEDYRRLYLDGTRNLIEWLLNSNTSSPRPSPPLRAEERVVPQSRDRERRSVFGTHTSTLKKFIYTSSTGVYGQNDGSLVDESSPTEPATETSKVLVGTEKLLLAAAAQQKFPAVIVRAAGIYGPGRGYLLKQFLRGEARIEGDGGRTLNMIHRDDLIGIIIAALQCGQPGTIYNAVDNEPVTQRDFFKWLCSKLN
ncbi:MAG TPA: SDR family oxidoreductase, partial [Verrucomicrobiota bacterium]|nr:SDR family oxidoreductase [Verrucomicrobiota bacterium]